LDEVFIRINGQQRYLWRAVDQDGDVIDILVQPHRDQRAAERFFRKLLRGQGSQPLQIITDKLRSYSAAMRSIFSNGIDWVDPLPPLTTTSEALSMYVFPGSDRLCETISVPLETSGRGSHSER
jgi:transposase-like protein